MFDLQYGLAVPTANDVAAVLKGNPAFINAIKTDANAQDPGFQEAIKNVMSQPKFDIPATDDAALNWLGNTASSHATWITG